MTLAEIYGAREHTVTSTLHPEGYWTRECTCGWRSLNLWTRDEPAGPCPRDPAQPEQARLIDAVASATLARALAAIGNVLSVAERAEFQALRWADPLPVPEWVDQVRAAIRDGVGGGSNA
jgi:hypothetical protein